ncbi:lipoprotein LpqH [Williamsia muralis]|uniref:lipoprotein LpqH n=1 Tax=Williamsia marianensis TaxID=85044 RepID=UPI000DB2C40A|nr:lipoprotein LpqH [Williamsia marianensis]PVY23640.1 lipoprotein antigen [Williamsia marianensis]PZT97512.1 MAG: hypothetical protein DI630_21440 [Gordonia sp. (in: high G+C Gram-positive bacteria)]
MKTAGIIALAAAACMLVACTTDQPETPPETSESDYEVAARGTPPEPGETIHRATIEATLDGQPITIIGFTKGCYRSADGNEVTIAGETEGYGYNNNRNNNINTGVGVGSLQIHLSGLRDAAPTVNWVNITQATGPETNDSLTVSKNVKGDRDTGTATATSETPDTYTITGSAPDPFDPAHTQTFTAKATCLQPPIPTE